jgi:hypothetical protein
MRDFERSLGEAGAALWTNFARITALQRISAERALLRETRQFAAHFAGAGTTAASRGRRAAKDRKKECE